MKKPIGIIRGLIIAFFCSLLAVSPVLNCAAQPVQLDTESQRVKEKVAKIGEGGKLTVKTKAGREFYGSVLRLDASEVVVSEIDLKQELRFLYTEIKAVEKGYGSKRAWDGTRIPTKKGRIGLALAAAIVAIPIILVALFLEE